MYLAGLVVVMGLVLLGIGVVDTNISPTDLGGGDELIKLVQDSPPTPTPTAGCTAADTGFLSPTSEAFDTGGDGDGFELNPTNAFADGSGNASNINGNNDRHRFYDYGFSIPNGCSIRRIAVRLDWWLDSTSSTNSMSGELSWDGGASWTATKTDSVESTTEHTSILGSSLDSWGRTWSPADLNDANFRVRLTSNSPSASKDFYLDWVPVKVHYGDAPSNEYYLHNNPTPPTVDTNSQIDLPLDTTVPTATTLYNYDQDRDGLAGLLVGKGGIGASESDATKYQNWQTPVLAADLTINGAAQLHFWSAMKDFGTGKRGNVQVFLRDYNGSSYTEITTGSLDVSDWQGGSGSWVLKTWTFPSVIYTVAAGNRLEVKIIVEDSSDDDMWFSYDVTAYDSRLELPP